MTNQIESLINSSEGKWTNTINDFNYLVLKQAAEAEKTIPDKDLERALEAYELPKKRGEKLKWLKCALCEALQKPDLLEMLKGAPIEEVKKKLLQIIIDFLLKKGIKEAVILAVINIILFLLKRALKKGIDQWCQACKEDGNH